jgi:hypothetical protein
MLRHISEECSPQKMNYLGKMISDSFKFKQCGMHSYHFNIKWQFEQENISRRHCHYSFEENFVSHSEISA